MMQATATNIHQFNKTTEKLSRCSKQELIQIKERNIQMLSQPTVIDTLPDKGSKLKEINQIIDNLLHGDQRYIGEVTVENTSSLDCPLVHKLNDMTVLTPHQGARKRSVDLANQQAFNHYSSSRLLSKPKSRTTEPYPSSIFHVTEKPSIVDHHAKVRMMTFEESLSLQEKQRDSVRSCDKAFDTNRPSQSLLKSLNLSMDVIQDVNIDEIEFPLEEDEDEDTTVTEEMMID